MRILPATHLNAMVCFPMFVVVYLLKKCERVTDVTSHNSTDTYQRIKEEREMNMRPIHDCTANAVPLCNCFAKGMSSYLRYGLLLPNLPVLFFKELYLIAISKAKQTYQNGFCRIRLCFLSLKSSTHKNISKHLDRSVSVLSKKTLCCYQPTNRCERYACV